MDKNPDDNAIIPTGAKNLWQSFSCTTHLVHSSSGSHNGEFSSTPRREFPRAILPGGGNLRPLTSPIIVLNTPFLHGSSKINKLFQSLEDFSLNPDQLFF